MGKTTHGLSRSLEYGIWSSMKGRCSNPNERRYSDYGGRNIAVCERWRKSFVAFLTDMGRKPSELHSIDRINNNGNYSCGQCKECIENNWPFNCRWTTDKVQHRNARNNHIIKFNNKEQCVAAWAEELKMPVSTLAMRLWRGWGIKRALTTKAHR